MNASSLAGRPFFFAVDYEMTRGIFIPGDSIAESPVKFRFPSFGNAGKRAFPRQDCRMMAFPEPFRSYEKKFEKVARAILRGDTYLANLTVRTPVSISASLEDIFNFSGSEFAMLGLYCRIGSLRENRELPGVKRLTAPDRFQEELTEAQRQALKDPEHRSETGEIATNPERGTLRVVTPRTESLSFFQNGLDGKILSVSGATPTFQIVTASAMDGKTLAGSGRILLFHQSDVTNRNIRFSSESMTAVEHWGIPESLIRRAAAKVTLRLPAGTFAVRAIGLDGLPKADIPAEYREGKLTFPIDTAAHGGTMIYLVERQ